MSTVPTVKPVVLLADCRAAELITAPVTAIVPSVPALPVPSLEPFSTIEVLSAVVIVDLTAVKPFLFRAKPLRVASASVPTPLLPPF